MRKFVFILSCIFSVFSVFSQDTLHDDFSVNQLLYTLNDQQFSSIYEDGFDVIDENFLGDKYQVLPKNNNLKSKIIDALPLGYYMQVTVDKNQIQYNIISKKNCSINIIDNHKNVIIQVLDINNEIIRDADVKLAKRTLNYDKKSQAYRINRKRGTNTLIVEWEGHKNYFDIQENKKSSILRTWLFKAPLVYIYRPLLFLWRLPRSAYESIKHGYLRGTLHYTSQRFQSLYNHYVYKLNRHSNKETKQAFFVLNKPMFKPGDTIKLNAFILDSKWKYYDQPMEVKIQGYGVNRKLQHGYEVLDTINPSQPSSYSYEFVIGKDIDLLLDRQYTISLSHKHNHHSTSFKYENYKLDDIQLSFLNNDKKHRRNQPFLLKIKAEDENNLAIAGADLAIELRLNYVYNFEADSLFIPTIILDTIIKTDPKGVTSFEIDSNYFPKAGLQYEANIKLETNDGREKSINKRIQYSLSTSEIKMDVVKDSIVWMLHTDKIDSSAVGELSILKNNFELEKQEIRSGQAIKLDPFVNIYSIKFDKHYQSFSLSNFESQLIFAGEIEKDSLKIQSFNPRNLPFSYFLYKNGREITRGYGQSMKINRPNAGNDTYILTTQYVWGGQVKKNNYAYKVNKHKIDLQVTHEHQIFPGESVEFIITATDDFGKPIENLNVLAHGLTSKFEHTKGYIHQFNPKYKSQQHYRDYSLTNHQLLEKHYLNETLWSNIFQLDSIEYYSFLFPKDSLYKHCITTEDSLTQFAPFVFINGKPQEIKVIFVDHKPVYFNWTTQQKRFSFPVKEGYHNIRLQTEKHIINLGSVYFEKKKKTILSIDPSQKINRISIQEKEFDRYDVQALMQYVLVLDNKSNHHQDFHYIQESNNKEHFYLSKVAHQQQFIGPILGNSYQYTSLSNDKIPFIREPDWSYFFRNPYIEKTSWNPHLNQFKDHTQHYNKSRLPNKNLSYPKPLNQTYFKLAEIKDQIQTLRKHQSLRKLNRYNVNTNNGGNGELQLNISTSSSKEVDFTIYYPMKLGSNILIFPGKHTRLRNLSEGSYGVIYFFKDGRASLYKDLHVKVDGINYYDLNVRETMHEDSIFQHIDSLKQLMENLGPWDHEALEKTRDNVTKEIESKVKYVGTTSLIYGKVLDQAGEPVIGATIMAAKARTGVASDFDGEFTINIASSGDELTISYIGLSTEKITVSKNDVFLDLHLKEDTNVILDEVMVKAYKVPLISYDQTSSVQTIKSESIGYSPLKSVSRLAATSAGLTSDSNSISIRGARFEEAHYYVDGIRVTSGNVPNSENNITSIEIIEGDEAQKVYGVDKVVLIETKDGNNLSQYVDRGSSLRSNFSDEGFWRPNLITDEHGKVSFQATFPDDITKWDIHLYAINDQEMSGSQSSYISSYKPISTRLSTPDFVIVGDTVQVLAKTQNYLSDSTLVTLEKKVDGVIISSVETWVHSYVQDSFDISSGGKDSIIVEYSLTTEEQYKDGERKYIPILPKGMLETKGEFVSLRSDQNRTIRTDTFGNSIEIFADADQWQFIKKEINHIRNYKYLCNEQLASKLLVLLIDRKYSKLTGEAFEYDDLITDIISSLEKRHHPNRLWGWWNEDQYVPWISNHVIRALSLAKNAGFDVSLNFYASLATILPNLTKKNSVESAIDLLRTAVLIDTSFNYETYINDLDTMSNQTFYDSLVIMDFYPELDSMVDVSFITDKLQMSFLGNYELHLPLSVNHYRYHIRRNRVMHHVLAYNVLKKVNPIKFKEELEGLKSYLMLQKINGYFRNTYEAAVILEILAEEQMRLQSKDIPLEPRMILSGDIQDTISSFPYKATITDGREISIVNAGGNKIYFTAYSKSWNDQPKVEDQFFVVKNNLIEIQEKQSDRLTSCRLTTSITAKKAAEYVMIEIPIPAGSQYNSKNKTNLYEVHREYQKNSVLIFCRELPAGEHKFDIELKHIFSGNFTVNPAKIELMYFPSFYGNNEMAKLQID